MAFEWLTYGERNHFISVFILVDKTSEISPKVVFDRKILSTLQLLLRIFNWIHWGAWAYFVSQATWPLNLSWMLSVVFQVVSHLDTLIFHYEKMSICPTFRLLCWIYSCEFMAWEQILIAKLLVYLFSKLQMSSWLIH